MEELIFICPLCTEPIMKTKGTKRDSDIHSNTEHYQLSNFEMDTHKQLILLLGNKYSLQN